MEQYQRLRGAQLRLVRRMLRLKRNKDETMSELIIRSNHILKHRLREIDTGYESWDQRVVQLRLDWGGHSARMGRFDPCRLTFRVFTHWNYAFIMNTISDSNGGRQLHGRHLHVWRWESYLYKFMGRSWYSVVHDREEWGKLVSEAKLKICRSFGRR